MYKNVNHQDFIEIFKKYFIFKYVNQQILKKIFQNIVYIKL